MAYDINPWAQKEARKHQAAAHTQLMDKLYSPEIDTCSVNTKTYSGVVSMHHSQTDTTCEVVLLDADTVSAARNNADGKTAVLNFASYKLPGGMFIEGSIAQEEALCHESFLYNVLGQQTNYYAWNNKNKNRAMYTNRALYSPNVIFTQKDGSKDFVCDVITCAAPNFASAKKYMNVSAAENSSILDDRCQFVLDVAEDNKVDTLILGAWGSGVFGQDAEEVARLFMKHLNQRAYSFKKVIFAVPKGVNGNYSKMAKVLR